MKLQQEESKFIVYNLCTLSLFVIDLYVCLCCVSLCDSVVVCCRYLSLVAPINGGSNQCMAAPINVLAFTREFYHRETNASV